jgi:hypothetical protein
MTVSIQNGNIVRVSRGEDPNSGVFFTYTDDDNPQWKINYLSVATGSGSTGLWRFQPVTEPREISYKAQDDDICIQQREGFSAGYTCAAHGPEYCKEENGFKKDFDQCCPCTCNPELPECLNSYVGCYRDNGNRDFDFGPKQYGFNQITCREACADYPYFAL